MLHPADVSPHKHRDPKTAMSYDHGRENMEQNAVNFIDYSEESA